MTNNAISNKLSRSHSSAFLSSFLGEGSPTKIDDEWAPFIETSLLEDLVVKPRIGRASGIEAGIRVRGADGAPGCYHFCPHPRGTSSQVRKWCVFFSAKVCGQISNTNCDVRKNVGLQPLPE